MCKLPHAELPVHFQAGFATVLLHASLALLWAHRQLLGDDGCICTCAFHKRCGDFLIWSYIYSEPGLEWDRFALKQQSLRGWNVAYLLPSIYYCNLYVIVVFPYSFKPLLYWSKQCRLNVYMKIIERSGELESVTLGKILIYIKLGQNTTVRQSALD